MNNYVYGIGAGLAMLALPEIEPILIRIPVIFICGWCIGEVCKKANRYDLLTTEDNAHD